MPSAKLWEDIASNVAPQLGERLLSPALAFWAGGVLAYGTSQGWDCWLNKLASLELPQLVALAVLALVIVAGSEAMAEGMQSSALRWLEGYWPPWLTGLRRKLVKRHSAKRSAILEEWRSLASRFSELTDEERERYALLDAKLATYPPSGQLLPTRLGNLLRAAEYYPQRYGLATAPLWPRLWLVLPEQTQKELTEARLRLDGAVRFMIWSTLFLAWTIWTLWPVAVAILGLLWGYVQILKAADVYGMLLRAAFDVHRVALYKALRWPLAQNPANERIVGRQLTEYLWRGSDQTAPTFEPDDIPKM